MSIRDRQKATDVFNNSEYSFAKKVSFSEAFPIVDDVKVVITRGGHYGINELNKIERFGKEVGEFVDCSNPNCFNGGISVGKILRGMIGSEQSHFSAERISCQGYEGSPKGKVRRRSCTNHFSVSVEITYKS